MYITVQTIITIGGLITAIGLVLGYLFKVHNFVLHEKEQDKDIQEIRETHAADMRLLYEENEMLMYGLSLALMGCCSKAVIIRCRMQSRNWTSI